MRCDLRGDAAERVCCDLFARPQMAAAALGDSGFGLLAHDPGRDAAREAEGDAKDVGDAPREVVAGLERCQHAIETERGQREQWRDDEQASEHTQIVGLALEASRLIGWPASEQSEDPKRNHCDGLEATAFRGIVGFVPAATHVQNQMATSSSNISDR